MIVTVERRTAIAKWGAISIACLILAYSAVRYSISQAQWRPMPFTAEFTESSTSLLTGKSFTRSKYWAIRQDGATSYGTVGEYNGMRKIVNLPERKEVSLSDRLKLKSTQDFSYLQKRLRMRNKLDSMCRPPASRPEGAYSLIGEEVIGGFHAYHYQAPIEMRRDGTSFEDNYWLSPQLNCFELQHIAYWRDSSGATTDIFEKKTSRVTLGDPQSDLFDVPADYREVKPSELQRSVLLANVQDREGFEPASRHRIPLKVEQWLAVLDSFYDKVKRRQVPDGK